MAKDSLCATDCCGNRLQQSIDATLGGKQAVNGSMQVGQPRCALCNFKMCDASQKVTASVGCQNLSCTSYQSITSEALL